MSTRLTLAAVIAIVSAAGMTAIAAPPAPPAQGPPEGGPAAMPDRPDLQARNLFQAGQYAGALAIYQRLYAETHHPTYLRNIGRCHQMLREPKPAIETFQAYLRDARSLDRGERAEIEGYIGEMQRLEVAAAAGAAPAASAAPPSTSRSTPSWSPGTTATVSAQSSSPVTHKWWFWTGLGALAAAGVIAIVASSGGNDRLPCPSGAVCPR
jgi:tetratricopeptide (TPR) repeat protein